VTNNDSLKAMGYSEQAQNIGKMAYDLWRRTAAYNAPDFFSLPWNIQVGWIQAGREAKIFTTS